MTKQLLVLEDKFACTDTIFQAFVAGIHSISEFDFNSWRRNYDHRDIPGRSFSAEYINNRINTAGCADRVIVGPPVGQGEPGCNDDIELEVSFDAKKSYEVALFKGVINFWEADRFHFFKARKFEGDFDIIFMATKNGEPVYFGDVSNDVPDRDQ